MSKKKYVRIVAIILAILMPVFTATMVFAEDSAVGNDPVSSDPVGSQSYESPDINELSGHGEEPEELSVTSGATYQEKAWYEYVMYSDRAVASYRVNDDVRILFYDPYTYTNSMVMDVEFDATTTEFDTASEYSISHTISQTMEACVSSTSTDTSSEQTSGRDLTGSTVVNTGTTTTEYNHDISDETHGTVTQKTDYAYKKYNSLTESLSITDSLNSSTELTIGALDVGVKETIDVGGSTTAVVNNNVDWLTDYTTDTTEYSPDYKTVTSYSGSDTVTYNTKSVTDGWTELSARITKTVGSSYSTSNSWTETETTTRTKTYAATHFASDGVTPLPWAIVHYRVQMPMKCCMQILNSGEWVTLSTEYCLLTTVQGTCRAWMQNGQVYYEDWGNGEPVVATDFWSQFMTRDQLMNHYSTRLHPEGGD